jgi:hypothetical protein
VRAHVRQIIGYNYHDCWFEVDFDVESGQFCQGCVALARVHPLENPASTGGFDGPPKIWLA